MGLVNDSYGIKGPPHRMVGWLSETTPFGKYSVLKPILRDGDSVLDVGCGTGMLVDWLSQHGYSDIRYNGLDLSKTFLDNFGQRYPHLAQSIFRGDALQELPKGPFDVAVSFGLTSDLKDTGQVEQLASNLVNSCTDVAIMEFWDKYQFKPIGSGVPPASWDPEEVFELVSGACRTSDVNLVRPLHKLDFALVIFKDTPH